MRRSPLLTLAVAVAGALLAPAAPARAQQAGLLARYDEMEQIAHFVVTRGRVKQGAQLVPVDPTIPDELKHIVPAMPPETLVFPTVSSSIAKERELLEAWIAAYEKICTDVAAAARAAAAEHDLLPKKALDESDGKFLQSFVRRYGGARRLPKKVKDKGEDAATAFVEMQRVLPAVLERYADVYAKKKMTDPQKAVLFAEREKKAKSYLKRYDLGEGLATTRLEGSALVNVELAPSVQKMAEDYLTGLSATPLLDEKGTPYRYKDRAVSYLPIEKLQADLRKTLEDLTGEFLVGRYAVKKGDEVDDILRVTSGRLIFGTFYFLEYKEEFVVVRG